MQDCVARPVIMVTNADLVKALELSRGDLVICNADKAALREWSAEVTGK